MQARGHRCDIASKISLWSLGRLSVYSDSCHWRIDPPSHFDYHMQWTSACLILAHLFCQED